MKSKLFDIMKQRESAEGRDITDQEIAEATGLSAHTIGAWRKKKTSFKKIDSDTVLALMDYCKLSGFDDLLYIDRSN